MDFVRDQLANAASVPCAYDRLRLSGGSHRRSSRASYAIGAKPSCPVSLNQATGEAPVQFYDHKPDRRAMDPELTDSTFCSASYVIFPQIDARAGSRPDRPTSRVKVPSKGSS
jgi:hypothetical protein